MYVAVIGGTSPVAHTTKVLRGGPWSSTGMKSCPSEEVIRRSTSIEYKPGMRMSCNLANVYTKIIVDVCYTFTRDVAANDRTRMILIHNKSKLRVQQSPVTSTRQPSLKCKRLILL